MDKATRTELRRTFLIADLPEPLTRASSHVQLFDDYISNTRIRLRSIRDPETKLWTRILQQREVSQPGSTIEYAEIYLNAAEYERFEIFEGTEIRKNRYPFDHDSGHYELDVYLWPRWGLNTAIILFENEDEMNKFVPPQFLIREITADKYFYGENLVNRSIEEIQAELAEK